MIDHTSLNVRDIARSTAFYTKALAPIGYALVHEIPAADNPGGVDVAGFGETDNADFWIGTGDPGAPPLHVAFQVSTRKQVDAFYRAAMEAGGTDNGAPGLRPLYHPDYYAAFVRDPDGHNIEAVCHKPQ